ncbi:MAG: T9SS type A sorting domain-containing protein [Actinobacteria bacterium]|nr:T9SS type A sorting domain-containing protein [Actinomycetota bacterium]
MVPKINENNNSTVSMSEEIQKEYSISNYPNPFNPSTTIQYVIPSPIDRVRNLQDFSSTSSPRNDETHVILKVYDLLGKEVTTLVNEFKNAGIYKIAFNVETSYMASLPSGVYFYTLRSGNYSETKKMIIIK